MKKLLASAAIVIAGVSTFGAAGAVTASAATMHPQGISIGSDGDCSLVDATFLGVWICL
jgi:hypothetical protein